MNAALEKLRILYFISIYQPIPVSDLRALYSKATDNTDPFANMLKELRDSGDVTHADPVRCTPQGQAVIKRPKLRISRDVARMFHLKRLIRDGRT